MTPYLTFKAGVRLDGIAPEMAVGLFACALVYARFEAECVVTSVTDGHHGRGSLHHCGRAVDLRIKNVPSGKWGRLREAVAVALGSSFDVVLELDHLHVEFDPS